MRYRASRQRLLLASRELDMLCVPEGVSILSFFPEYC